MDNTHIPLLVNTTPPRAADTRKVLFAGDIHGQHEHLAWLFGRAETLPAQEAA